MPAFTADYAALLDAIRGLQPQVPLYCLTPKRRRRRALRANLAAKLSG
jgi:hypothetical protein